MRERPTSAIGGDVYQVEATLSFQVANHLISAVVATGACDGRPRLDECPRLAALVLKKFSLCKATRAIDTGTDLYSDKPSIEDFTQNE
jgi:hypothetical protein